MANGDDDTTADASTDVDSAGVYYLSIEEFEARSDPEDDEPAGAD